MELVKAQVKIRCEMGACKNIAAYTVKLNRVGIRSQLHICENCLCELYSAIGKTVVPKCIETVKPHKQKAN